MGKDARGENSLLKTRAWEVAESPVDLGYRVVPNWLQMPEGWELGQVAAFFLSALQSQLSFIRGHYQFGERTDGDHPSGIWSRR